MFAFLFLGSVIDPVSVEKIFIILKQKLKTEDKMLCNVRTCRDISPAESVYFPRYFTTWPKYSHAKEHFPIQIQDTGIVIATGYHCVVSGP